MLEYYIHHPTSLCCAKCKTQPAVGVKYVDIIDGAILCEPCIHEMSRLRLLAATGTEVFVQGVWDV